MLKVSHTISLLISQIIQTYGSVSPIVGNSVIYSQNDKANMYARFYNTQRDQLWDENATAMGAGATVTWANSKNTILLLQRSTCSSM